MDSRSGECVPATSIDDPPPRALASLPESARRHARNEWKYNDSRNKLRIIFSSLDNKAYPSGLPFRGYREGSDLRSKKILQGDAATTRERTRCPDPSAYARSEFLPVLAWPRRLAWPRGRTPRR